MGRTGCADIRDGDLFHGRYRILRSIEDDRTGALYEAIDMLNNSHRILKVVQADTLAGAGIRVRFKSDAPLWDSDNVAYLSDVGLDRDTRSFFLIMDLAEDSELEPITRQRVIHLGESGSTEETKSPSRPDMPVAIAPACQPTVRRASVPLPLPPPLPPSPSRVSHLALPPPPPALLPSKTSASDTILALSGRLPPPTPPPEKTLPEAAPSSSSRMFSAAHFFVLVAVAISVGSVVYCHTNPAANESAPQRTLIPTALATPDAAPIAATMEAHGGPDASMPTNWISSEMTSIKSEKPATDAISPKAPPNTSQPESTTLKISKPEPVPPKAAPPLIPPASTKQQRESIF